MGQKFKRGTRVYVMPAMMPVHQSHFESGFEAIVEHTYSERYWGDDVDSYSLIVLENNEPVNAVAWYYTYQLALVSDDISLGLGLIEKYYNKN